MGGGSMCVWTFVFNTAYNNRQKNGTGDSQKVKFYTKSTLAYLAAVQKGLERLPKRTPSPAPGFHNEISLP